MDYEDFLITFTSLGGGRHRVVTTSSAGDHPHEFSSPLNESERLFGEIAAHGAVEDIGRRLFRCALGGEAGTAFATARQLARQEDRGLRIKLKLSEAPELSLLPWEVLHDGREFLALSKHSPVLRYVDVPAPIRELPVDPPVNILAVVSDPVDQVRLDVGLETKRIREAIKPRVQKGLLHFKVLAKATLAELQRELRRNTYHVLHFVGHGTFTESTGQGALLFLKEEGDDSSRVDASRLAAVLGDHRSLRLVMLNSCKGARASIRNPFASLAVELVRRNLPAVVAMQHDISDEAAIRFGGSFYAALSDGCAVDTAVAEARKAVYLSGNDSEWATPALFARATRTDLFDPQALARHAAAAAAATPPLIVYLVDASSSMAGGLRKSKAEAIRQAFEATFDRLGRRAAPGCRVAVLSYSETWADLVGGIRSVHEAGVPVIEPQGGTNTADGFTAVERLLRGEMDRIQDGPPPLVIHITDGQFTGADPSPVIKRILGMKVREGNVLIANLFLADGILAKPAAEVETWAGVGSRDDLADDYARFLFDLSSAMPESYRAALADSGYALAPGARMLFPGPQSEWIDLAFALPG